eukprot:scaffold74050_cov37-Tisochrysis_lutea.AAC.5
MLSRSRPTVRSRSAAAANSPPGSSICARVSGTSDSRAADDDVARRAARPGPPRASIRRISAQGEGGGERRETAIGERGERGEKRAEGTDRERGGDREREDREEREEKVARGTLPPSARASAHPALPVRQEMEDGGRTGCKPRDPKRGAFGGHEVFSTVHSAGSNTPKSTEQKVLGPNRS